MLFSTNKFIHLSFLGLLGIGILFGTLKNGICAEMLIAKKVKSEIHIDGIAGELAWSEPDSIFVYDNVAKINITIKALYDENNIYILVQFPDPDENRSHKSWVWDNDKEVYTIGPDREDVFVIKWFIDFEHQGLSIYAGKPHTADLWYWKANRTDPSGFADDKFQYLQTKYEKRSAEIKAPDGEILYLLRKGDSGRAAYISNLVVDFQGEQVPRFDNTDPTGSRADVKAKGKWEAGKWSVEFKRALNTTHNDDLRFDVNDTYTLGVSRFEIAGRPQNPKSDQPLYGSGDVSQKILFSFEH